MVIERRHFYGNCNSVKKCIYSYEAKFERRCRKNKAILIRGVINQHLGVMR